MKKQYKYFSASSKKKMKRLVQQENTLDSFKMIRISFHLFPPFIFEYGIISFNVICGWTELFRMDIAFSGD